MTTMKALVKAKAEPGIWMSQEPVPMPEGDEVLIKIKRTAICGTDIHIYKWDKWSSETIPVPMIVGHEFSGVIEELGPLVARDDLKVGMRVSGEGHIIGNRSRAVRAGRYHLDPDTQGVGVNRPGAFAEYLTIPAFNVVKLPDDISDETASILDPLGNAVHTALAYDLIGEDVLVTGAGPIGIMAAAVARHVGARNVVITDMNDDRLALATQTADVVPVNVTKEDLGEVMAKLGMTEGFDIGFEMSGAPQAFDQMVEKMIMGGRISMLGLPSEPFATNWPKIVLKALTIKGVYGREMFETWYRMLAMLQSGLDVSGVITHRFKVDDFQTAFDTMLSGKSGKVILEWD